MKHTLISLKNETGAGGREPASDQGGLSRGSRL